MTKPQRFRILILTIGDVCISMLGVYFALMTRNVIDAASASEHLFIRYSILLAGIVLVQYVLNAFLQYETEYVSSTVSMNMREHLMKNQMEKSYEEVRKYHSGEWINRMFSDVRIVASGCTNIIPNTVGMIARLLFACGALLMLESMFAGVYLCTGILMIVVIEVLRKKYKVLHIQSQKKEDTVHSFLQELSENILIIKSFAAHRFMLKRLNVYQEDQRNANLKKRIFAILTNTLFSLTFRLGYVIALIYGGRKLLLGLTTYGTLMAVLQLVNQIQSPIAKLSGVMTRIFEVTASTERLMESDQFKDDTISQNEVSQFNTISFQDVSFQYDRDLVLDHVSFEINRGDTVALTGISGGGKSTIFLLMMGIYQPDEGQILFDGNDANEASYRNLFAYVPQGNALFSGTIEENIVFNQEFDTEKLKQAMRIADAESFINELPEGVKTVLKENGGGLSEGQIQRIAIARAVYNDAPVLLLDESTSALDEMTEARVLDHIRQLKNKTVLIVTHRKAALNICSRHLELEDGRIRQNS
ncbi:MAG: ABC transporter ATP-binding protein [Erysipelotrichaceae bacterium]|nr:ABC transporter ATP-binding protein [Erysipelotrichaceae bacterium]